MADVKNRKTLRVARHKRVRRKLSGTSGCPRLAVFKSAKHLYAQVIDDSAGRTLASVSTVSKDVRGELKAMKPVEAAEKLGAAIAERAKTKGIVKVVFDRGGFPYRGRVKALAEAARTGGLEF